MSGMGAMGGGMTGLGTSYMYARLVCELVGACVKAVEAAGRFVAKGTSRSEKRLLEQGCLQEALVAHGYAQSTAHKYEACVLCFLGSTGRGSLKRLRDNDVSAYLETLAARGLGNASLRLHLCALRAVFDKMLEMEITRGIAHAPRPVPRPPATDDQLALLRQACGDSQARFIVDMLNRGGIRPGILVSLALAPPMKVEEAEGCVCTSSMQPVLSFASDAKVDWLFPSPVRAGPMSVRTLQRRVTRLGALLGFRVTCTAVRKARVVPMGAVA